MTGQHLQVKVCGITHRDDALAAVEAGATALGFNFYRRSPRYITASAAAGITALLPGHVLKVGVFVNESAPNVAATLREAGLDIAQLHGDEAPGEAPAGVRLWKALQVNDRFEVKQLDDWQVEAILLDSAAGGSGLTFDWRRAAGTGRRIVLAGGLDASNVAEAIRIARPWGVDSCSRLESAPGRKDHARMRAFIQQALETV
jgi:phosphoribosylanthranilate isomerase